MDAWKNWPEHFGIDSEHAGAFAREGHGDAMSPGNLAKFFTWCIHKGLIDQQGAAQFVAELSAKPIVNAAFFDQPIDPQVWELVKGVHAWSPTLVPLGYWEDHLLLGTPLPPWETPPLRKLRTPPMIVVAPALDLLNYFERLTGQTSTWSNMSEHNVGPLGLDDSNSQISVERPPGEQTMVAFQVITRPNEVNAALTSKTHPEPMPAEAKSKSTPASAASDASTSTKPRSASPTTATRKAPSASDDPFAALAAAAGVDIEEHSEGEAPTESDAVAITEELPEGLDFGARHADQAEAFQATTSEISSIASEGEPLHSAPEVTSWKSEADAFSPPTPDQSLEAPSVAQALTPPTSSEATADPIEAEQEPVAAGLDFELPPPPPRTAPPSAIAKAASLTSDLASASASASASAPEPETESESQSPSEDSGVKEINRTVVHDFDNGSEEIVETPAAEVAEAPAGLVSFDPPSQDIEPEFSLDNITKSDLPAPPEEEAPPTAQIGRRIADGAEAGSRVIDFEGTLSGARVNRQDPASSKIINISSLEPMMLDDCHTFDQIGAQVLLQVQGGFESGMILLFQGGHLMPWKWSDLMLSVKGEHPDPIQLDDPSVFRIVYRSALPYHGYVVTNPTNQKFFNEFSRGMLPKHMTIMPIMIEKQMCGMLLAISNQDVQLRQSLRMMERLAFELSRGFKRLRGGSSKAA